MNFTKDISFYPSTLTKNSRLVINYTGKLKNSAKLFLEYSYSDFRGFDNPDTEVVEMLPVSEYFYVLVNLKNADHFYFRFVNNEGIIDDLNGITYCEQIHENVNSVLYDSTISNDTKNIDETHYNMVENNIIENYPKISNTIVTNTVHSTTDTIENNDNSNTPVNLAMVPIKERNMLQARKGLRFTYKLNKRIKLILIKLFRSLPSFITGNYRRRINL